ncbi:mucin-2-like [Poeciliopsis prolifica]|uniref:mucin-2-like n=1 Tax=Poeciliopsis prolifica TaxID=188132 RepID=UPI002412EA68|nr:mucin-2-like [Poeciliopsis prolifica]
MSRSISCEQTLITGSELLMMTHQTSPAEVELKCYYMVKRGGLHQSPYSKTSTVTVHNVQETESTKFQRVTTVSVTDGQTFRTTVETESPFSDPPSSVNPSLFGTTDTSGSTTVNTLGSVSTLSTSPSEAPVSHITDVSESDLLTQPLTPAQKDLTTSQTIVPVFPVSTVMMIWRFIAVGLISLILIGLTLKCCISRMEKCFSKRSKAEVSVEQIQMSGLNNRDE